MTLAHVADAIEAGHIGDGWIKNKNPDLKVAEIATICKKCKTPWPCFDIARARAALASDMPRL